MKLDLETVRPGAVGLMSARQLNELNSKLNQLWNMMPGPGVTITKGEPWIIQSDFDLDTIKYPSAPMWEIYVYRSTAPADWQVNLPPSAIFITGPFERVGRTDANHIVKITAKTRTKSRVDRDWCRAFGFVLESGYEYYSQKLSKCPDTGDLLISNGLGSVDRDGNAGLFFAVDWQTGARQFSPFANIEALVPNITLESVTGVASCGDTIALSVGFLGTNNPGIALFDTSGTPVETSAGNYIFQLQMFDGSFEPTYWWLIGAADGYRSQITISTGGETPFLFKVNASVAAGMSIDSTWKTNGGDGGYSSFRPRINSGEDGMHAPTGGWAGVAATTQFTSFTVAGVTTVLSEPGLPDIATYPSLIPFDYIDAFAGIVFGVNPQTAGDNWRFFVRTYTGSYVLTEISGFNGAVLDVKYFRTKDDGVTRQFIVVGEFTTYQGQPAPYLLFVDQNGNRLADLEWPA